jgi:glycosyltransferase involved in cell wall biosynthesis
LPAFREAFGLVVAESLACGTPAVVMRDGGGAVGIITTGVTPLQAGDVGWVADPDPGALASVLADALASAPDPALAAACRARAADFGIDGCAERYESLYAELASTAA